jgi:predicted aminopeptidase
VKRKIIYSVLVLLTILILWQYELISYGLSQGYGQLSVIYNTKPVEEVLKDPSFPDSLKARLLLIKEIKQFAFDSLGINYSENYSTVFDQKGKGILWTVTGCEPYSLKAKEWEFPVVGSFSYKGFFDYKKALTEEKLLKEGGYDTSVDEIAGWSTLGWFKDPVLSSMLSRSPGSLANLIIHELTHGTLYVKDNVDFNENLASFVGDKGALIFLEHKYGKQSKEYEDYKEGHLMLDEYTQLVFQSAQRLDSLYNSFNEATSVGLKKSKKEKLMNDIVVRLNKFFKFFKSRNRRIYDKLERINNTYFMDFKRYRKDQSVFENEFNVKFKGDFRLYLDYLKKKYPSL